MKPPCNPPPPPPPPPMPTKAFLQPNTTATCVVTLRMMPTCLSLSRPFCLQSDQSLSPKPIVQCWCKPKGAYWKEGTSQWQTEEGITTRLTALWKNASQSWSGFVPGHFRVVGSKNKPVRPMLSYTMPKAVSEKKILPSFSGWALVAPLCFALQVPDVRGLQVPVWTRLRAALVSLERSHFRIYSYMSTR